MIGLCVFACSGGVLDEFHLSLLWIFKCLCSKFFSAFGGFRRRSDRWNGSCRRGTWRWRRRLRRCCLQGLLYGREDLFRWLRRRLAIRAGWSLSLRKCGLFSSPFLTLRNLWLSHAAGPALTKAPCLPLVLWSTSGRFALLLLELVWLAANNGHYK